MGRVADADLAARRVLKIRRTMWTNFLRDSFHRTQGKTNRGSPWFGIAGGQPRCITTSQHRKLAARNRLWDLLSPYLHAHPFGPWLVGRQ